MLFSHAHIVSHAWATLLFLGVVPTTAMAEIPGILPDEAEVGFDIPNTLACRNVTTPEFSAEHPGESLIEVRVPLSLLLYHGEPERLKDVVIEVDGAPAELRVFDYAPKTQLRSEHTEPIAEKESVTKDKSLGASVGAKLPGDITLTPSLSGGFSKTESNSRTVHKLAPKRAVVVSGTTNSRRAVYYKLRQSSQSTLEGEHEFVVTFVAPHDWPGGSMEVRCVARGKQKWLFVEKRKIWNETSAPVELRLVSHVE